MAPQAKAETSDGERASKPGSTQAVDERGVPGMGGGEPVGVAGADQLEPGEVEAGDTVQPSSAHAPGAGTWSPCHASGGTRD